MKTSLKRPRSAALFSGPITDTLGARIAFNRSDAKDNWIDVINSNQFETGPLGPVQTAFRTGNSEIETEFVLATLLWEPTDNFFLRSSSTLISKTMKTGPGYGAHSKGLVPDRRCASG